jgi:hypothetical protein
VEKMKIKVRFIEDDHGNCRKYYLNIENNRLYALQQGFKNSFNWYTCTKEGEPDMPFRDDIEVQILSEAQLKEEDALLRQSNVNDYYSIFPNERRSKK